MEIGPRISELLHHYDCVIVPELGGFVTEYRSARIDRLLNVIHPPSKDLRFNAQLKKNDGLLANAISQADSISHEAANSLIKQQVEAYFSQLEEGKSVHFEKVGVLYLDSHKNVQFSLDSSVNYLMDSYRLKKVFARPMVKHAGVPQVEEEVTLETEPEVKIIETPVMEKVVKEEAPETEETPVIPITEPKRSRAWMAAALIPLLFYIGMVTVNSNVIRDGSIQMSDLNPFHTETVHQYEQREIFPSLDQDITAELPVEKEWFSC